MSLLPNLLVLCVIVGFIYHEVPKIGTEKTISYTEEDPAILDLKIEPEEHLKDMKVKMWISDSQYEMLITRTKVILGGFSTTPTPK